MFSSSEDKSSPFRVEEFCTEGVVTNDVTSLLMKLFNTPCDNLPTIQCLNYELFKLLQSNSTNPITTYSYPLHPKRHLNCTLIPHGPSLSSSNWWTKIIQKLITDNRNKDEDANDTFFERKLYIMDTKLNDCFLNA